MIIGYVRNDKCNKALELLHEMQEQKIKPTEVTMVSLLNACPKLGAIKQGEWIIFLKEEQFWVEQYSCYSNYRHVKSLKVLKTVPKKGLSCWNSMILGLAMNGYASEAMQLFSKLETSKFKPDYVSFIGVPTAWNHFGMVDKAKDYIQLMNEAYKIKPSIKHYGCIVDVLGRARLIEEAEQLVKSMPLNPDAIV